VEVEKQVLVEKIVEVPVERIVERTVEKIVPVEVEKIVYVDRIVELENIVMEVPAAPTAPVQEKDADEDVPMLQAA